MLKVPFNQQGLELKKQQLYALPAPEFRHQLSLVQYQTRNWIVENFQLNSDQVAYIDAMPQNFLAEIGLQTTIAFDYDLDMVLETPATYSPPLAANRSVEPTVKGYGSWTPGEPPVIKKIEVGVKIKF